MSKDNNGWISVEEQLPPQGVEVLIYVPTLRQNNGVDLAWFDDGSNGNYCFVDSIYGFDIQDVTHWQPLPKPPIK